MAYDILITIPPDADQKTILQIVENYVQKNLADSLRIAKKFEARFGELSVELAREQIKNEIAQQKTNALEAEIKDLNSETQELRKTVAQRWQVIQNLIIMVQAIIQYMNSGTIPFEGNIAKAMQAALQGDPNTANPFASFPGFYELWKGNEALHRMDIVAGTLEGYNPENYKGKTLDAGLVLQFVQSLVDPCSPEKDFYGATKVLFAQAKEPRIRKKPAAQPAQKRATRHK